VVIYGAGKAGHDLYSQLSFAKIDIALWVDKNYRNIHSEMIVSPRNVENAEYDLICIAAGTEELAQKMISDVLKIEGDENKIFWKKPLNIY
jgi:hypothetical protein